MTGKDNFFAVYFLPLVCALFPFTVLSKPVEAISIPVGVVKSQENAKQWTTITERLQAVGVGYCILETRNWQEEGDLNNFKVLFLPNVENITGTQAIALQKWMSRGGQVIITGPTGNLAQPEIRSQLKSLFGAYWGFSNTSPAILKLNEQGKSSLSNQSGLSSNLMGGVIIPTGVNSQTLAIWMSKGKPPAVVGTNKATYLGWRWGIEGVSPGNLDAAWLKVALSRHGVTQGAADMLQAVPCQTNSNIAQEKKPATQPQTASRTVQTSHSGNAVSQQPVSANPPRASQTQATPVIPPDRPQTAPRIVQTSHSGDAVSQPPVSANPPRPSQTQATPVILPPKPPEQVQVMEPVYGISPGQIAEMNRELSSLIARYESTLLAAEASNSNVELSPKKITEVAKQDEGDNTPRLANRSYKIVQQAKETLETFQQLVGQRQYDQARELWLKARRTLWDNYPTDRQFAQAEIRAMWLDRGTIVQARSEADLAQVFDRMAQAGINVVFFETLNASYPIYPSAIAPEQNPLTQGWDPLRAAVKLAHERGMEIHAWTWIFAAANQRHNEVMGQPKNYLGPVLSRHPDWVTTNKHGEPFDYGRDYKKAFYDPANPEVQRYLLSLLEEIVRNYDVDGVQFDYIRYPFQSPQANETFGYGLSSRWLFKQQTGVDPIEISPSHPLWNQWTAFRTEQVSYFVANASARLKQIRPNLTISAAVFPMEQRERLFRLQQNWEDWGRYGWVDMICLMTYALDTGSLEDRTRSLYEPTAAGASLIIPGIRLLKVPDSVTLDQMQLLRNMPTTGFALFAAENLTPDLQSLLNRTQGAISAQQKEPLPHRQPFQAAAIRFQALQKEWGFLIVNQQLAMNEGTMKHWGQQVDYLAGTLNQLAQQPSPSNLSHAQSTLRKFRSSFYSPMGEHKQKNPYQVQVWQDRLETIERLLVYGERLEFQKDTRATIQR